MANQEQTVAIGNKHVKLTSLDKPLWPKQAISKRDYLKYLQLVSPRMLPFLQDRCLTVIRFPHGVDGESFYQKNCPDYAPQFVQTFREGDIHYILCNDLATLIWLGNQLALEFHIPFQTIHTDKPTEIVFDLDPPSRQEFTLAVEAALLIQDILNRLKLRAYVKLSGSKGMQIYIPLPNDRFTYQETRRFTQFIARYLVQKEPDWFTIERLKAKRGKKLYVDYLQHAEGKTIIAPYSTRGHDWGLIAVPLEWHEVGKQLSPLDYTLEVVLEERLHRPCPFATFFQTKESQPFAPVLEWLSSQGL
jgi:DNA ligase D